MNARTSSGRFAGSVVAALIGAATFVAPRAHAAARGQSGWYHTGDGVMTKTIIVVDVDVLAVGHDMKCLPDHKSKAEVVTAACDKRFVWRALRDLDEKTVHESLREGYRSVDYRNDAKVSRALSAFTGTLDEGAFVTITYDAAAKATTFWRQRGGSKVTVAGEDFMRATWSILFANRELSDLGDDLIRKL